MNRLLLLFYLCPLWVLPGCQLLIAETGARSAPAAVIAPPLTSQPPLTTTVAFTVGVVPTLAPLSTGPLTITMPVTTTIQQAADTSATVEAGLHLYRQYYCGICHQLTAAGTKGTFGPSHDGIGQLAMQRLHAPTYRGTATTVGAYLHESLVDPQVYIVPGYELTPHRMPSFGFLPPDELATLVQWLSQQ